LSSAVLCFGEEPHFILQQEQSKIVELSAGS